jgi:Zn-dependent protease with chaperone function
MNAISRNFEWQADRFAVELQDQLKDEKMSDMGDRLGRALIALHVKNLSTVWVDWLYVPFLRLPWNCLMTDCCLLDIRHTTTRILP